MGVDLESISEATSGAIGSLLSTTILYPLDTCKSKFQAEISVRGQQKYRFPLSSPSSLFTQPSCSGLLRDHDPFYCVCLSLSRLRS